ncbi:MAG: POTRA domain-containing protein [Candidatus Sulfotelmatobacter sp.]
MLLLPIPLARAGTAGPSLQEAQAPQAQQAPQEQAIPQEQGSTSSGMMAEYEGKQVEGIQLPGVPDRDRAHLLQLLLQKVGQPLSRDQVRESIRALFATGRFADIQAEAAPSAGGVTLTFTTSPNLFVGAVSVEGAPTRPNFNQIVNASKLQLGDLHTAEKLDRAVESIRQLMQENGYYRARVTADTKPNAATQQVDITFHVVAGEAAHVGEVKVTGTANLSAEQIRDIAGMQPGDRVTAARVSNSLRRLRKKFQKQQRVLSQVSIALQEYRPRSNSVDYTFQIDPGPVVLISVLGFHVSRGVLKHEVPVYEENAIDDDLLNEGKRNLLDYLQNQGHFDAKVEFKKESDPKIVHVIYQVDPGPRHRLVLIEITGITGKSYFGPEDIRSRLQIQSATPLSSHGRYSGILLKSDVATLQGLYRSNGFRQAEIQTKVDDDYKGVANHLAVHLNIVEGPQTLVSGLHVVGSEIIPASALPELQTRVGQPFSEQTLGSDRERILTYYFNRGFPNATLDIATKPTPGMQNREDVTYTIQEGERFSVDQVMVSGLDHTRDYIVQREIQVHAGDPLSQADLLDTQTKLYDLGIFNQVDTAVQNPEGTDPQKNVLVQVQEAKRYTFTYDVGLEFQTGQPAGSSEPAGSTGVSPRVGLDVTRLNLFGRNQTLTFQSHVGRLQQRGLISYTIPKVFSNDKFKLIFTIFYDNSLDVATFTSQRWEGKVDLRQQINKPSFIVYRFDYRRVKASNFASDFSPALVPQLSLPARVSGPGFTYIRDKRDNPLESTRGNYFTLDSSAASTYFGSESDFGRALSQYSTYYAFGGKPGHQFVFARSTTIGLEQPFGGTKVLSPGTCPLNGLDEPTCTIETIPLPEQFFAGGGNSHRGFGLNEAGPRDPDSGFPVGGTALFVNSLELRLPPVSLPWLGPGFGFAIFHDMGNVFTAGHDMVKGLLRWHQADPGLCLSSGGTPNQQCLNQFDASGYDYTSHAVGVGVRYKTPIGPLRFDFGYDLNPTAYYQEIPGQPTTNVPVNLETQRLRHFNFFFSIGQPF